jgi:ABC-type lipoprotein release transport system permease subunit
MPFKLIFQLSVRNLFRYPRRNGLLLLAIAFALAGATLTNSLMRGWQYDMLDRAVENLVGHVKVQSAEYRDDPNMQHSFTLPQNYAPQIAGVEVVGWAPRVKVPAVVLSERQSRGVQLVGVDPEREGISFFADLTVTGDTLTDLDDGRILLGAELARQLQTSVGRKVVVLTQGADGKNRERGFRIAGTFNADGTSLEKAFAFTGLTSAQRFLRDRKSDNSEGLVTEVSVLLADEPQRQQAVEDLAGEFPDKDVADWRTLQPQAAEMFAMADVAIYIIFVLMMGGLAFGLVNTLIAAVMERVRELGMLRAIGMQRRVVLVQVVTESMLIMSVGIVLGLAAGCLSVWALADGIDLSAFAEGIDAFGMSALLVPMLSVDDLVMFSGLSLVLGFVASVFPALRAVRITPLMAMNR